MGRDFDEVVDVRSGLAYLLVKWKIIVLAAVIGAVIGGTYGGMKSSQSQSTAVTGYEETISNARAACSEEGALYAEQGRLFVRCGDGNYVELLEVQPHGSRAMDTKSYLLGHPVEAGQSVS